MHYATPHHAVAGPHGEAPGSVRRQKKQGESKGKCLYGGFLSFFFFYKLIYFIYLFLAALGLRCCAQAFSSCGEQGLLFVVEHRL